MAMPGENNIAAPAPKVRMPLSSSNPQCIFPDKPITKKPLEVRMGSGKGGVEFWVCRIKPGMVLYEMEGVDESVAREAFRLAGAKLPIRTTFATRKVM